MMEDRLEAMPLVARVLSAEDAISVARSMLRFLAEASAGPPEEGFSREAVVGLSFILDAVDDVLARAGG